MVSANCTVRNGTVRGSGNNHTYRWEYRSFFVVSNCTLHIQNTQSVWVGWFYYKYCHQFSSCLYIIGDETQIEISIL